MFELESVTYRFLLDANNELTITKKNGKVICKQNLEQIEILHFSSQNMLGNGSIVLMPTGLKSPIIDSFRREKAEKFSAFYSYIRTVCPYRNMSLMAACTYTPTAAVRETDEEKKKLLQQLREPQKGEETIKHGYFKPSLIARINAKKQKETECTCGQCNAQWYVNDMQVLRFAGNTLSAAGHAFAGDSFRSAYHINNAQDPFACPKCGSKKVKKKDVYFWIDKKGNYIE